MVSTRAQERGEVRRTAPAPTKGKRVKTEAHKAGRETKKPRQEPEHDEGKKAAATQPSAEKGANGIPTGEDGAKKAPLSASAKSKIQQLISAYGNLPLHDSALSEPDKPTAETILAHVMEALVKATRISHNIADDTVRCLIKAGYQDVQKLKSSTWEQRTEVLTEGGYSRYREKAATELGDLAEFVIEKYDGDMNNISSTSRAGIRSALKEIKGIGDTAVDIFFTSIQHLWPSVAPWIAPRSLDAAKHVGIGTDVDAIYEAVGKNPQEMCKLARAVSRVKLDKKEKEFV